MNALLASCLNTVPTAEEIILTGIVVILYASKKYPAIISAHPIGSCKEQTSGNIYGEALVKACAENGSHYCDLTGEPQFIHRMLAKYESTAKASGACIVHCCGFDSIPSDIGTYYLQQQTREKYDVPAVDVDMRVKALSGGISGGTIASLMNVISGVRKNPGLKKVLFNPYALCPHKKDVKQTYVGKAQPDWVTDQWIAPFVMAAGNSKVVMRSSQQLTGLYPDAFRYNEAMLGGGQGSKSRRKAKTISFINASNWESEYLDCCGILKLLIRYAVNNIMKIIES